MIFVTGGEFSGKSEYVRERFGANAADGASVGFDALKSAAAVKNFHLFIKNALENDRNIKAEIDRLLRENPGIIIISNELGCGVVPMDKTDRIYRESVGRINCYLAQKAERVIRVVCGIGQTIK